MRRYDKPNKTKRQWEAEMRECLEDAEKRLARTKGQERLAALEHYRKVLEQFNSLTIRGKIPPEAPCYS